MLSPDALPCIVSRGQIAVNAQLDYDDLVLRVALPLLLASGCHEVFGADHLDAGVPPGACTPPPTSIDFEAPVPSDRDPCQPFGFRSGAGPGFAPLFRESGELVVAPEPLTAQGNGCSSNEVPLGPEGVFVEVTSIFTHVVSFVQFKYTVVEPPGAVEIGFSANDARVYLLDTGNEVRYDAQARWWRLRPTQDPGGVVGEVSPDGVAWREVGRRAGTPPAFIRIVLGAGINDANAIAPGLARFEHVNVCP